jgi:3-hydroxyacyl-[acyl-carrier-protein] dehydratase
MILDKYTTDDILQLVPHKEPFRFIDKITYVDDSRIEGHYYFHQNHEFYKGHFPGYPITPGVILIEVMAQIGLVAFGLYLLTKTKSMDEVVSGSIPVLASVDVKFSKKVLPGEYVFVKAEKTVFRHGKLICQVMLLDNCNCVLAKGSISGFIANKD